MNSADPQAPTAIPASSPSSAESRLQIALAVQLALMCGLLLPILAHKSQNPWLLGRYSKGYLTVLGPHGLAIIAATLALLRARARVNVPPMLALVRTVGFWFWVVLWAAIAWALALGGAFVEVDRDLFHFAKSVFFLGVAAEGIVLAYSARLGPFVPRAALSAAVLAIGVGFVEFVFAIAPILPASVRSFRRDQLRYLDLQKTMDFHQSIYTLHRELGYKLRRNLTEVAPAVEGVNDAYTFQTDIWGFFNPNFDPAARADVVIVGDSFVAEIWPDLLRRESGLEVVNHGVTAYSPPQYTTTLQRYSLRLKPRAVLYCIYLNDAIESARFEDWRASGSDWFSFNGGRWFGAGAPGGGRALLKRAALKFSAVFTLADYIRFTRRATDLPARAQPLDYRTDSFELVFDRASYTALSDPTRPAVARGFDVIERSIAQARVLCANAGTALIVLLFPPKELVHFEGLRATAPAGDPIENLQEFYRRLKEICDELGVECHDLTEPFRAEVEKTGKKLYRKRDSHWDIDGSGLTARIAQEVLAEHGIAGPPTDQENPEE